MARENVRIQILYSITDGDKTFQDALYFTPEEYANITDETIEALKQERFTAWLEVVNAPAIIEPEIITE